MARPSACDLVSELLDSVRGPGRGAYRLLNTSAAAASVKPISSSPCAADTKPCLERRRRQIDALLEHAVEETLEALDVGVGDLLETAARLRLR